MPFNAASEADNAGLLYRTVECFRIKNSKGRSGAAPLSMAPIPIGPALRQRHSVSEVCLFDGDVVDLVRLQGHGCHALGHAVPRRLHEHRERHRVHEAQSLRRLHDHLGFQLCAPKEGENVINVIEFFLYTVHK